jgi:NAD(P)-dependent dehydrogenase (short-subunit alcohol dehydrogenase family)
MARVFITGSADGLGLMVGRLLAEQGHRVVLHARSEARAEGTQAALPQAEAVPGQPRVGGDSHGRPGRAG